MGRFLLAVAVVSIFGLAQAASALIDDNNTIVLNLAYVTSNTGEFVCNASTLGAELAVERINEDEELLPGYSLNLTVLDSKCNADEALKAYFDFWTKTKQTGPVFFGGGCSGAAESMSKVSNYWHTIHMTYCSSDPKLGRYANHFRTLPDETTIHQGQAAFVSRFREWEEVALVIQNDDLFIEVSMQMSWNKKMERILQRHKVTVRTFRFVPEVPLRGLELLWEKTPRVLIVNGYQPYVREVLCLAHNQGKYYPNYQFIMPGWFTSEGWFDPYISDNMTYSCGTIATRTALTNSIGVHIKFQPRNTTIPGRAGLSYDTFKAQYDSRLKGQGRYNYTTNTEYGLTSFDAVYAVALAMNSSLPHLDRLGVSFEEFNFSNTNTSATFEEVIQEELAKVQFLGVSGPIAFTTEGDRNIESSRVFLYQWRELDGSLSSVEVAEINVTSSVISYMEGESQETLFRSGIPRPELTTINVIVFAVMTVLASVGIIFSVVCLLFNVIFMRRKYIKLTSPLINVLICLGAILMYAEIVFLGIPTEDIYAKTGLCNVEIWAASIGFTLVFGALVVKTWRIYYIFSQVTSKKSKSAKFKPPKDWMLLLVICGMLVLDIIFLVVVTAVPTAVLRAEKHETISLEVTLECKSDNLLAVLFTLLALKSIYLWVGLFLAFENRRVNIPALDDSKYIAASVYCSFVTCIPLVPIGALDVVHRDIRYGIIAGGLLFANTIILALLFIPRMLGLRKRWNEDTTEAALRPRTHSALNSVSPQDAAIIAALRKEVEDLKSQIKQTKSSENDEQTASVKQQGSGGSGGETATGSSYNSHVKPTLGPRVSFDTLTKDGVA